MARVSESNVISRWGTLAVSQAGREGRFFELVQEKLKEHGWPYPVQAVDVGSGLFSKGKPYLETKAGKLVAYIGAESIGNDMFIGWSLTIADPGLFKKALAVAGSFSVAIFQDMSFNEVNSARAFASTLNLSVQEAADIVLDEAGLDKTRMSREASGPLGRLI